MIDGNDVIKAMQMQRNAAMDDNARLLAENEALKREIETLKRSLEKKQQ